jgi:uncharacterized protein
MNRNQVLPQVELSADLNALRRVDFCAAHAYKGEGFLDIQALPRVAEAVASVETGDGFNWQVDTYFVDSPGSAPKQMLDLGLKGRLHLVCQRCLQECALDVEENRHFFFVASEADAEAYPMEDDQLEPLVASQQYDLLETIEDEILLSLPLIPKHPEGVCEAHSVSLGGIEGGLDASEKLENPFNILKNMKKNS